MSFWSLENGVPALQGHGGEAADFEDAFLGGIGVDAVVVGALVGQLGHLRPQRGQLVQDLIMVAEQMQELRRGRAGGCWCRLLRHGAAGGSKVPPPSTVCVDAGRAGD